MTNSRRNPHAVRNRTNATRDIVATTTHVAAAELLGVSDTVLRHWGGSTTNPVEVEVAMSRPGVVFWAPLHERDKVSDFTPIEAQPSVDDGRTVTVADLMDRAREARAFGKVAPMSVRDVLALTADELEAAARQLEAAVTPFKIAERYARGDLSEEATVSLLSHWPYSKATRPAGAGDDWQPGPGTWRDVEDARDRQLIPADLYARIRDAVGTAV